MREEASPVRAIAMDDYRGGIVVDIAKDHT